MLFIILAATVGIAPAPSEAGVLTPQRLAEQRLTTTECRGARVQHASRPQHMSPTPLARMPLPKAEKAVVRMVDGCMVPVQARFVTAR